MEYNRGVSFQTIAGSGSNGAVIHYRPTVETDSPINSTAVFLRKGLYNSWPEIPSMTIE